LAELTAAHRGESAKLVKQLNKEIYWTGWYAVNSSNTHIQWTTASFEGQKRRRPGKCMKKEQIEQEKT